MKVGQTNESLQADLAARVGTRTPSGTGVAGESAAVGPTDQVAISQATRKLQVGSASEPFDAEKVNAVRAAIERGEFHVDAQKVADKMINEAAALLERISAGPGK